MGKWAKIYEFKDLFLKPLTNNLNSLLLLF